MGRKSRKKRPPTPTRRELKKAARIENEPRPEGEEWVEWGGELIWAAGFTAGGAPYGLTVDQFRKGNAREGEARGADWARAKRLLHDAFVRRVGRMATFEIGFVRFLGDGLCRKAFIAEVSLYPDPEDLSDNYVVLLPRPDAERSYDERAWSEARLPLGLIDWEWAQLGDPAYDLSIVTRGARRPFQIDRGLDRLLEAYAARRSEIRKEHVHLYELCMIARWYVESLQRERERGQPPEHYLSQLLGAFRRVGGGG